METYFSSFDRAVSKTKKDYVRTVHTQVDRETEIIREALRSIRKRKISFKIVRLEGRLCHSSYLYAVDRQTLGKGMEAYLRLLLEKYRVVKKLKSEAKIKAYWKKVRPQLIQAARAAPTGKPPKSRSTKVITIPDKCVQWMKKHPNRFKSAALIRVVKPLIGQAPAFTEDGKQFVEEMQPLRRLIKEGDEGNESRRRLLAAVPMAKKVQMYQEIGDVYGKLNKTLNDHPGDSKRFLKIYYRNRAKLLHAAGVEKS